MFAYFIFCLFKWNIGPAPALARGTYNASTCQVLNSFCFCNIYKMNINQNKNLEGRTSFTISLQNSNAPLATEQ